MKKLCLVLYVFGEKYQEFIPLFLLSLFKLYPDYGVRIYLDRELLPVIKEKLGIFSEYDYKIIENYKSDDGLTKKAESFDQIQKCRRWYFYDDDFKNYDAIYIGDVDIFFCPEKNELYEAHIKHCETLQKPFSNIKRIRTYKNLNLKLILRNIIKFGMFQTIKFHLNSDKILERLSGLHFIKTEDYINKVLPLKEEFINELNLLAEGKSKKYNFCMFNNEGFLYDLMLAAGFGDIPDSSGKDFNISEDCSEVAYRPHHGMHFGIFRSMNSAENERKMITSDLYIGYYKYFCDIENTEEYKVLEKDFSPYLKSIINNMHEFYQKVI